MDRGPILNASFLCIFLIHILMSTFYNSKNKVYAANMEIQFGGGISGAIARATQDQVNIDKDARYGIIQFWADDEAGQ